MYKLFGSIATSLRTPLNQFDFPGFFSVQPFSHSWRCCNFTSHTLEEANFCRLFQHSFLIKHVLQHSGQRNTYWSVNRFNSFSSFLI